MQPVTDNTNIVSVAANVLVSPPPAFTPGTHATPANPRVVADPLSSPTRPAANRAAPLPSPIPPPSAGKQELNDAAMALTWLAEALTAPNAVSPLVTNPPQQQDPSPAYYTTTTDRRRKAANTVTPYAATAGMQGNNALYTTPYGAGLNGGAPLLATSGGLRGRRAASQRCSTVVQEAILNDRLLNCHPRSLQEGYEPTPRATSTPTTGNAQTRKTRSRNSEAALAASAERKLKGYSENSRVGRAMISILEYVTIHQPEYHGVTPFGGVPERIIRQEFGNNPDTSKALRFLVSEKKIVRKGAGGRRDPFNYVLSNSAAALTVTAAAVAAATTADMMAGETAVAIAVAAAAAAGGSDEGTALFSPPTEKKVNIFAPNTVAAPATVVAPPSLTPAAAAASLTAPSTCKWPATIARVAVDPTVRGSKSSQPRLSLEMADPLALEQGRAAAARDALAKQMGVVGSKRPQAAPSTKTVSFNNSENAAKRPAYHQKQQQQWTGPWPTQLPSGQRLTSLAPPLPLSMTPPSAANATNPVFLLPTTTAAAGVNAAAGAPSGTMLNGTQQEQQAAAAQAYLIQLKAAQMIWNQQVMALQMAQQQQQHGVISAVPNAAAGEATGATVASAQQQQVVQVPAAVAAAAAPATAGTRA